MLSAWGLIYFAIFISTRIFEISGHGYLIEPVHRGSAWRKHFPNPINWDDSGNYCGGYRAHFIQNKGVCGPCGDDNSLEQPRPNENGGIYGRGIIVRNYTEGQEIDVAIYISANHWGTFSFALCPLESPTDVETNKCFDEYPVKLANGEDKYVLKSHNKGLYKMKLALPDGFTCEHCSLRWNWKTANSWGTCDDGIYEGMGCGDQETFRTCSDISITAKS